MCGLAGVWRLGGSSLEELELSAGSMARAIHHRGPDDFGIWSDSTSGFALAHKRLAVLDLTPAGHQPMRSASGRFVMAFNGEIYNHRDLRKQLENVRRVKRPWDGHSDTETLLAAIEAWGLTSALERSAGMFALALWDRAERRLHLARDRFGEKPLYWGWLQQGHQRLLAFASELAALRALPGVVKPRCNPSAVQAFFQFGCIPAPLCIYEGLHQLQPGHWVQLDTPDQTATPQPWWDAQQHCQAAAATHDEFSSPQSALEVLHSTLQEVIREQALADVPLGTFLSGGIDSSLITALLQAQSTRPVRSFTIAFPDSAGFNEAPFAASVAAHLGTEHTEVPLTAQDALALIPQLPRLYSEPFADSSQLPTHLVCREARRSGLTVALSGDGGDELFGGYNRHRLAPALQSRFGSVPHVARRAIARGLEHLPVSTDGLTRDKRRKLAAAIRAAGSLQELYGALTSLWPDPAAVLQPHWRSQKQTSAPWPMAPSPADQLMLADVGTYLPSDILVKVDRAAMAASLETRAPFLDHRVAAAAWRLPLGLKIRGGCGKWALRQLLGRYVPPEQFERPKAGFAMPIGVWLRGPMRPWAEELLQPQLLQRQGYLQFEPIQRLWQAHQRGADYTSQLWSVLMWQAWLGEWG